MTKRFKTIWLAIGWALAIFLGFMRFLIKKPQATLVISRFVVSKLHKVPKRVKHEACLDKDRTTMAQRLNECARLYLKLKPAFDIDNLKCLEKARSLVADRWALLYLLVRNLKPDTVVETGVGEGKSTSYILQGLADNGQGLLMSVDLPNQFYMRDNGQFQADFLPFQERPGRLVPSNLRDRWRLVIGNSRDRLPPLLAGLGKVDLFLHDSEHTYETMFFEFTCVWPYLRSGGYLVADDAIWSSALFDFAAQWDLKPSIIQGQGFLRKP